MAWNDNAKDLINLLAKHDDQLTKIYYDFVYHNGEAFASRICAKDPWFQTGFEQGHSVKGYIKGMPKDLEKRKTSVCLLCIVFAPAIEYGIKEIMITESVVAEVLQIYKAHMEMAELVMDGLAEWWGEPDETGFRGIQVNYDRLTEFMVRLEAIKERNNNG